MADTAKPAGRKGGIDVDTALVRELAELLAETGLSEIEVEDGDRKIRVARGTAPAAATAYHAPPPAAAAVAPVPAPAVPAGEVVGADVAGALASPMVGTVYLAAEPGTPNFVSVGDQVTEGTVLVRMGVGEAA